MSEAPERVDVAVVGAGPAGLSAAAAAAGAGASVLVLDEGPGPGGLLRWQTRALGDRLDHFGGATGPQVAGRLERAALDAGAAALYGAAVWDIDADLRVSYLRDGAVGHVQARRLIAATGSTDGVDPFPGWTLPGVVGMREAMGDELGAVGRHALVIGGGDAAVLVAGYLPARSAVATWHDGSVPASELPTREAMESGVSLLAGYSPACASGTAVVDAVELEGPCGRVRVGASLVVLATHRVPDFRAASLLRARASYRPECGGWAPDLDAGMRSSDPRVLVAGDAAGIAGAARAAHQGTVAGLSASSDLGLRHPDGDALAAAAAEGIAARAAAARAPGGQQTTEHRAPRLAGLGPDVVACRCSGVTVGDIDEAVGPAGGAADEIRRLSRAGMGVCQGRMCDDLVAELASARSGVPRARIGRPRTRAPLRPVPLPALAAAAGPGPG